jgi:hypothetical protein
VYYLNYNPQNNRKEKSVVSKFVLPVVALSIFFFAGLGISKLHGSSKQQAELETRTCRTYFKAKNLLFDWERYDKKADSTVTALIATCDRQLDTLSFRYGIPCVDASGCFVDKYGVRELAQIQNLAQRNLQ